MSIVTLTLNPTVDVAADVEQVVAERKLRCSAPFRDPGGGGINVARAIVQLGGEATAVFPCGGATGQMLVELLDEADGVEVVAVPVVPWTREGFTVTETSTNRQFRFNFPGSQLTDQELQGCVERAVEETAAGGYLVVSGSLPPGAPAAVFSELARAAGERDVRLVVDTSGDALRAAVDVGVHLLKPNAGELAALVGVEHLDRSEAAAVARRLVDERRADHVLVTLGAAGALLVTRGEAAVALAAPMVRLRSRVGAGDSTVGGMVLALSRGLGAREAARHAMAAGTAAVMTPGTQLCRREDAEALLDRIDVQALDAA